jgi:hypothetical protein
LCKHDGDERIPTFFRNEVLKMKKLLLLATVLGVVIFTLGCPAKKKSEPPKSKPPVVDTTKGMPTTGVTRPEPPKAGPANGQPGKGEPPKTEPPKDLPKPK